MDKEKIKAAWQKIVGKAPSSLDDDEVYKHPIWKQPTPKVDAILAAAAREWANGNRWSPKTKSWEEAEVREWQKIGALLPVMPKDIVLDLFPGARVVGSELTSEELAMIKAGTTDGYRDKDGVWRKVEDDGPRCQEKSFSGNGRICGGPIVEVVWPDRVILQCHYCGRAYDSNK